MPVPAQGRLDRIRARELKLPSERDWERSPVLEPVPGPRHPELICDGGGLPFPPAALAGRPDPVDPEDAAAAALLAYITRRAAPKRTVRALWKRGAATVAPEREGLEQWRELARTEAEVLFARGLPPRMLTAALRRSGRRGTWAFLGSSAARPLRATRDGIRASSWRLDPEHEAAPGDKLLRVLVTEQAFASGRTARERILPPEIYLDAGELVVTIFVTPEAGYQNGTPNPETPARIALPEPVGSRRVVDGALFEFRPA
jgi:hypothetical protein